MVSVMPANSDDIESVMGRLCSRDVAELRELYDLTPQQAIPVMAAQSRDIHVAKISGEPVLLFGVLPPQSLLMLHATPWALTTDRAFSYPKTFLRESRRWVQDLAEKYPVLQNWTDASHWKRLQWASFCGFTVHVPEPYGPANKLFCRIELRTKP